MSDIFISYAREDRNALDSALSWDSSAAERLQGTYAGATTVGALVLMWALVQGQDWNMWLALAVPLMSWGILGFKLARRSVTRAAGLALLSLLPGVIIFGTAPG